jgi:WD40 repeat protein
MGPPRNPVRFIRVWDASSGATRATLMGHTGGVDVLAVAHDGSAVVTGSGGLIRLWNIRASAVLTILQAPGLVADLQIQKVDTIRIVIGVNTDRPAVVLAELQTRQDSPPRVLTD